MGSRPSILCVAATAPAQDDVAQALAEWADVVFVDRIDDLLTDPQTPRWATIILHLTGLAGDPLAAWEHDVQRLVAAMPVVPIVIYCRLTPATAQQILAAGRAGINLLSLREINNLSALIRETIASSPIEQMLAGLTALLDPLVGSARDIIEACLRNLMAGATTVTDLAQVLQVSSRTIANRLHLADLASPERVISQCRVLVGIRLMEPPLSCSASISARTLGFSNASEFRGMVKRVTGLAPLDILDRGGVASIAHVLRTSPADPGPVEPADNFRLSDQPFPLKDYPPTLEASA